jgi:xanthine phosphoribosyltransferase
MPMAHKQFLSWPEYHQACDDLTEWLRGDARVRRGSAIVTVPRGGLVAAAIIAYGLRLDRIWAWNDALQSNRDDIIVIDDICDTGKTFKALKESAFPNALYAAPYVKPQGRPLCTHWSREVPQDTWLVMPYAPDDEVNR